MRRQTFGDPDLVVAVVDSGIDATHPELSGNVLERQPQAGRPVRLRQHGWQHVQPERRPRNSLRERGGGQHQQNSVVPGTSEGIAGVAGNCRLIGILPGGTEARYAEMYLWAAGFDPGSTTPASPLNLRAVPTSSQTASASASDNPISGLMSDTFDRLTDDGRGGRGVLLFFSAGNDNVDLDTTFRRPWSMYDRCFGVAASTLANDGVTEIKAAYSNFGPTVDWCAPSNDDKQLRRRPSQSARRVWCPFSHDPGGAERRRHLRPPRPANNTCRRSRCRRHDS